MAPETTVLGDGLIYLARGERQASEGGVRDQVGHVASQARPEGGVVLPAGISGALEVSGASSEECAAKLVQYLREGRRRSLRGPRSVAGFEGRHRGHAPTGGRAAARGVASPGAPVPRRFLGGRSGASAGVRKTRLAGGDRERRWASEPWNVTEEALERGVRSVLVLRSAEDSEPEEITMGLWNALPAATIM